MGRLAARRMIGGPKAHVCRVLGHPQLLSSGSLDEGLERYFRKIVPIRKIFARLVRRERAREDHGTVGDDVRHVHDLLPLYFKSAHQFTILARFEIASLQVNRSFTLIRPRNQGYERAAALLQHNAAAPWHKRTSHGIFVKDRGARR